MTTKAWFLSFGFDPAYMTDPHYQTIRVQLVTENLPSLAKKQTI